MPLARVNIGRTQSSSSLGLIGRLLRPPICNLYEYGFRVPLIIVSPYVRQGYISQVTHDFGSIHRFIEEIFGLPSLGYADARADNLSDCFDFSQQPLQFKTVRAPMAAKEFIEDDRPPTPPDDD